MAPKGRKELMGTGTKFGLALVLILVIVLIAVILDDEREKKLKFENEPCHNWTSTLPWLQHAIATVYAQPVIGGPRDVAWRTILVVVQDRDDYYITFQFEPGELTTDALHRFRDFPDAEPSNLAGVVKRLRAWEKEQPKRKVEP